MILRGNYSLIVNIFIINFFKSVHTLLLRPSPYPCTQKDAFGGTSQPPTKGYVLYGWPLRRTDIGMFFENLVLDQFLAKYLLKWKTLTFRVKVHNLI